MRAQSKENEAWLSLVERCVRDAEVASSNLVASTLRPVGQAVKTTPSHGVNPGSIPGQVIKGYLISDNLFCLPFCETKKECALAHSRAERGRLRHVSASRECASSRSVFCFIGRNFL